MFSGSMVAIVTPFTADNRVDFDKLGELVEMHVREGTSAIVPCGTTGESPTLSHEEHDEVVERTIGFVNGRLPVIAGAGSNSTDEAIRLSRHAEEAGAAGILSVTPYYNKPSQEGLRRHFTAVADAVGIPVVLYNIPGRSGVGIALETLATLSEHKNIRYIKEATGSVDFANQVAHGTSLTLLSGDDPLTLPLAAIGAKGVISVTANIAPRRMADLTAHALAGRNEEARKIHFELYPVFKALFAETNPLGLKAAMDMMGLCSGRMRLPLCEMQAANKDKVRAALAGAGLLKG